DPRICARIGSPAARAIESRLSTTTPHPSPRTYPFARASKALHLPSGESACDRENRRVSQGESIRLTPAAMAMVHSSLRRLWQARCTATSDEEHAVSTDRLGPWRPSVYESLPGGKQWPLPVAV